EAVVLTPPQELAAHDVVVDGRTRRRIQEPLAPPLLIRHLVAQTAGAQGLLGDEAFRDDLEPVAIWNPANRRRQIFGRSEIVPNMQPVAGRRPRRRETRIPG